MQKFSTWMILSLDVIFWIIRVIATYTYAMGMDFMVVPLNMNMEVILLFIALICFIFIAKRNWLGPIVYLIGYGGYFGVDLYNNIVNGSITSTNYASILFSFFGIVLPLITLLDLALDKNRKAHPTDKKTDWFYKDEKFDRKLDERADKNNYKTL